jgi:hypothetical protein
MQVQLCNLQECEEEIMSVKGEKYASKKSMMKHEKTEGKKERKMEYGSKAKMTTKKMGKKK